MEMFILFRVDLQVTFSKLLSGTNLKVQKHKLPGSRRDC